jgi:hypothetical protein
LLVDNHRGFGYESKRSGGAALGQSEESATSFKSLAVRR